MPFTFPKVVDDFYNRNLNYELDAKHFERTPGRDGEWIYEKSEIPWLQLDMEIPYKEMFEEAKSVAHLMLEQDYPGVTYEDKNAPQERGWMTICVHGLGMHKYDRCNVYGYEHEDETPYGFTEIADKCPVTVKFLKSLPYKKLYRARFTMLQPGGYAAPHIGRKKNASYSHKINFALNHPEGFHFLMEKQGDIPWKEGRGFLLNVDENFHSVINRSETPRIHLITMGSPDWERMGPLLERSYYNPEMEPKMRLKSARQPEL